MATPKPKRTKSPMSDQHKAALAVGRDQGRAVRRYLDALELNRPKRGRKRTPESIERRLADIASKLDSVDRLSHLQLVQERIDLQLELAAKSATVDLTALETEFVKAAAEYGTRKGISYAAWRETGVDAAVLKKAGVGRARGDV